MNPACVLVLTAALNLTAPVLDTTPTPTAFSDQGHVTANVYTDAEKFFMTEIDEFDDMYDDVVLPERADYDIDDFVETKSELLSS